MARRLIRILERIVSIPGTLDDLKKWRNFLNRIVPAPAGALLSEDVRGWLMDKAAFLMATDRTLLIIGWVAVALTLFTIGAILCNTYRARRAVWMKEDEAHVLLRDNWLAGRPPDMRSPWNESIGRNRMHSFYKVQSYLDDFEKDHSEAVSGGRYQRKILSAWIGRKLRGRETSVVDSASEPKVAGEKADAGTLPLIPILEDDKTSFSVAVQGRELDEVKLAVNRQPRAEDLQWTDGGTEFRTIVQNMKVFAELCDVRFSCQGGHRPTFGLRYRVSGSDWMEPYMSDDGPGTQHSGKLLVQVAVVSHKRGVELHDLIFEAVWFAEDADAAWPFEAELRVWFEGPQELPLFHRYERGFWS